MTTLMVPRQAAFPDLSSEPQSPLLDSKHILRPVPKSLPSPLSPSETEHTPSSSTSHPSQPSPSSISIPSNGLLCPPQNQQSHLRPRKISFFHRLVGTNLQTIDRTPSSSFSSSRPITPRSKSCASLRTDSNSVDAAVLPSVPMPAVVVQDSDDSSPSTSASSQRPIWRLGQRFFSSSSVTSTKDATRTRQQTSASFALPDPRFEPPPSQFAAWSEAMYMHHVLHRCDTFNSVSSGSACAAIRPSVKKVKSQESVRSANSNPLLDRSTGTFSSSSIPVPKSIKLKLKTKSKNSKGSDFDRVFLAQELSPSSSLANSSATPTIGASSPVSPSSSTFVRPPKDTRKQRASWAPPGAAAMDEQVPHRPVLELTVQQIQRKLSSSSSSESDSPASPVDFAPSNANFDNKSSIGSRSTTLSTIATSFPGSDASPEQPKSSPTRSFMSLPEDNTATSNGKPKRSKSAQQHKTWALKFSQDGKYLAAAGTDRLVRVYEVLTSAAEREEEIESAVSSRPEADSGCCSRRQSSICQNLPCPTSKASAGSKSGSQAGSPDFAPVFKSMPVRVFQGHTGDILDLCWSKNNFLLSCSTDRTAKLWHPQRSDCLCTFTTSDIISSVDFHPSDDRYFISGGLDGKLRLWNISARKLQSVIDVPGVVTAVAFSASGKIACVGTHSGAMLTFSCSSSLKYLNTVAVKSKSAGKNAIGSKITAITPLKMEVAVQGGESAQQSELEYMMITSNDSRVRFYSISSKRLISRFKSASYVNRNGQIRAATSSDSQYMVSGSEDSCIYLWDLGSNDAFKTSLSASSAASLKRSRSVKGGASGVDIGDDSACRSWTAGSGPIRCAVFAPSATINLLAGADDPLEPVKSEDGSKVSAPRIIISTDDSNMLKVWRTDPQAKLLS